MFINEGAAFKFQTDILLAEPESHSLTTYLPKIHLNIILIVPSGHVIVGFPTKFCIHSVHMPSPS
jgi:hypothetical protein